MAGGTSCCGVGGRDVPLRSHAPGWYTPLALTPPVPPHPPHLSPAGASPRLHLCWPAGDPPRYGGGMEGEGGGGPAGDAPMYGEGGGAAG